MKVQVKLLHHYRDLVDSWDESPFKDIQEAQIDETTHTIKGTCVFGTRHSKNGYDYEDAAISRLALLTEGAKFFINHPSKSEQKDRDGVRDIRDWAGVYTSPRQEGAEKVFADLKVRPAFWELVRDVAIMKPPGIGNSINSRVKIFKDHAGKEHVVDIDVLKSIDLVASAATTSNLFESHKGEAMEINVEEIVDQILVETQEKTQEDMTYQLVRDISEGLLADKIKEQEISRKVSELQWKAGDAIEEILKDKAKDMKGKKTEITAVLDDLESMINDILAGKKVAALEIKKEDDEMEFGKLTLEDLSKERPDIIKMIEASIKGTDKVVTLENDNKTLKTSLEAMTTERDTLKTSLEAVTKERDILKAKVDEYETKEKGAKKEAFIAEKMAELKVPKDIITPVFKTSLMTMEDKDIVEAMTDRKDIFLKGQKVVRGAGDEHTVIIDANESTDEITKKTEKAVMGMKEAAGR
ncbi:MAG: hypothetical protein V2A69_00830 [Pseudomonadota bacterium]